MSKCLHKNEATIVRAQQIYDNSAWPNPVVVKLEKVEFAK